QPHTRNRKAREDQLDVYCRRTRRRHGLSSFRRRWGGQDRGRRLEPQVPHHGWWYVDEDAFAANLVVANVAADEPAHAVQAAPLAAIGERRLQAADELIFVIGQDSARL